MLVLSRKKNEAVRIGINGEITICVVELRGDKVRLGIVAPKEIPVHRQEVHDAIHRKGAGSGGTQDGRGTEPRTDALFVPNVGKGWPETMGAKPR